MRPRDNGGLFQTGAHDDVGRRKDEPEICILRLDMLGLLEVGESEQSEWLWRFWRVLEQSYEWCLHWLRRQRLEELHGRCVHLSCLWGIQVVSGLWELYSQVSVWYLRGKGIAEKIEAQAGKKKKLKGNYNNSMKSLHIKELSLHSTVRYDIISHMWLLYTAK